MEDNHAAYVLYKEGVSQKDIAKLLTRSEQTVSRWKREGNWDTRVTADLMAMDTIHETTRDLVQYQLQTLRRLKEKYTIEEKEGAEPRLISKGDIDGARDLYNMIKEKEVEWVTIVRIVRMINQYFTQHYPDLARQAATPLNEFLNEQRGGDK